MAEWEVWSPPEVPHVSGRYTRRIVEDGQPQPQRVEMRCSKCEARHVVPECASGRVRQHIQSFAIAHAHVDAFAKKVS